MVLPRLLRSSLLLMLATIGLAQTDASTETSIAMTQPTDTPTTFSTFVSSSIITSAATSSTETPSITPSGFGLYAPSAVPCPGTSLLRVAKGLSDPEAAFVAGRRPKAIAALTAFLKRTGAPFPALRADQYPTIALASSGGGNTATLSGAGFVKGQYHHRHANNHTHEADHCISGIDGREGLKYSTSGLYQALTYHSALSGGGQMLSTLATNDFPTISQIQTTQWALTFSNSPLLPGTLSTLTAWPEVKAWVAEKFDAGFPVSVTDVSGLELAWSYLDASINSASRLVSNIASMSSITSFSMPMPIIQSTGVDIKTSCKATSQAVHYETTPYEFGSWGSGAAAFTPSKYLGTGLVSGLPSNGTCTTGFDRQSLMMGTSSNIYPGALCPGGSGGQGLSVPLSTQIGMLPGGTLSDDQKYTLIPNPYRGYGSSPAVAGDDLLRLADGGAGGQGIPVWPYLFRPSVSVVIANENSPTKDNLPTGAGLYNTYLAAKAAGLSSRMPVIPSPDVFSSKGLLTRPTFFGCNSTNPNTLTVAYFANRRISFNSAKPLFKQVYSPAEVNGMIGNGALIASNNKAAGFGTCMGCLVMKKSIALAKKKLPAACNACLTKFCYN